MALLLVLLMLTACAAAPQDLTGHMFTFPEETNTANVRLNVSTPSFAAATVCFRFITDLSRPHVLFSLSTPRIDNTFLIFKTSASDVVEVMIQRKRTLFGGLDYQLNTWHSVCSTWDSASGLVQLWFDGKPTIKKFAGGSNITAPIVILGQEQDSYGGGFNVQQSFVGMMSGVHMWNYVLSSCEVQNYVDDLNFTPGNVLNWRALEFQISSRVLVERKGMSCH